MPLHKFNGLKVAKKVSSTLRGKSVDFSRWLAGWW